MGKMYSPEALRSQDKIRMFRLLNFKDVSYHPWNIPLGISFSATMSSLWRVASRLPGDLANLRVTAVIPDASSCGRQDAVITSPSVTLAWRWSPEVMVWASLTFPLPLCVDTGSRSVTAPPLFTLKWWKFCFPSFAKITQWPSCFLVLPSLTLHESLILQGRLWVCLSHFWVDCCTGLGLENFIQNREGRRHYPDATGLLETSANCWD